MQLPQLRFRAAVCTGAAFILCSGISIATGQIQNQNLNQNPPTNLIVTVRHAPVINGGKILGSIQQLSGDKTTLTAATVTGDFLVPGTPTVRTNGAVKFQGIIVGTGNSQPSGYPITLNNGTSLRYIRTRINPVTLPAVSAPPRPTGTRNVTLTAPGQTPGSFSTLRNLTVNSNAGLVTVPPGTYGAFTANSTNGFIFGTAGATKPAIYNLQNLTLNGSPRIQLLGPATIVLSCGLTVNGTLGTTNQPQWLQLNLASGALTLNGNTTLAGQVLAPNSCVTINGNSLLLGSLICDQLALNTGGVIAAAGTTSTTPTNRAPAVTVTTPGTITWPTNQVVLTSVVTDDGLPLGNALKQFWGQVSGPGTMTFSAFTWTNALTGLAVTNRLSTTATFNAPGSYVLRLTVDDGQLTNSTDVTVKLNQAPIAPSQDLTTLENTPLSVALSAADADGDPVTIQIVSQPGHGNLTGVAPDFIYQPATNYTGPDHFTFKASDSQAESPIATVSITITAPTNPPPPRLTATRSSKGTDFWLTFLFNPAATEFYIFQQVLITADTDTDVEVVGPGLWNLSRRQTNYYRLTAGTTTRLDFPPDLGWYGDIFNDVITNNSIHISASAPVNVYGFSREGYSADGYLALPTAMLGTNYLVMAYGNGGSQFAVLATEDKTRVTINPTAAVGNQPAGQSREIILEQGQTYRVEGADGSVDYTGTSIASDKPIAVLGGATSAYVPRDVPYADHLVEEMMPVDQWGQHFATMPLKPRLHGDTFRFLASADGTQISINGTVAANLDQGQFHEQIVDGPANIQANKPILVAQFANGTTYDGVMGDPFMMLVPPVEQFCSDHLIEALSLAGSRHYWEEPGWSYFGDFDPGNPGVEYVSFMNLVVSGNGTNMVQLDDLPVSPDEFQRIGDSDYFGAQLAVSNGIHHITAAVPVGVCVYGWSTEESYALSGGIGSEVTKSNLQLSLNQTTPFAAIGKTKTISARVTNGRGLPVADIDLPFRVSGANPNVGHARSSRFGEIQFSYFGNNAGVDVITSTVGDVTKSITNLWVVATSNLPPVVSLSNTPSIQPGLTLLLSGAAIDDGLPARVGLNIHWRLIDGPGQVVFEDPHQAVTHVTCGKPGTYWFELSADDSQFSSHAAVDVIANLVPTVQFPWVDIPPLVAFGTPIELAAAPNDPDGRISRVDFYANGVRIGTATTNSDYWNGYNIAWTPSTNGVFRLSAVVCDELGASNISDAVSVRVDCLPVIAIDGVVNGSSITVPTNVVIHASAVDPDGVVASLSIYLNGELIGTSTNGDISVPWFPRVAGNYTLSVTATDDLGLTITLENITVIVTGIFPHITITSPVPMGFAYDSPTGKPITLKADASIEAPYQITNVSFFAPGETIGSFSQPPYTLEWTPHRINYHQITVEADADSGAIGKAVLWVNSIPDASISFTQPGANQPIFVGQPVQIRLAVTDPWNILQAFDYFVNGQFLGETNGEIIWTPPSPGNYNLYAQGVPFLFRAFSSAIVSYAIPPASVGISSPLPGATVYTGVRTPVRVTFDNSALEFEHAEFFANGQSIGQSTNSFLLWIPAYTNDFTLSATVFDRFGQSCNSTNSVTVHALTAPPPQITIVSPTEQDQVRARSETTIVVALADPGQLITNLEFYVDGQQLGDVSATFMAWTPDQTGNHKVRVIAAGSDGSRVSSTPVNIAVTGMNPPTASLSSPVNDQRFTTDNLLAFSSHAADLDGFVTKLNIILDSAILAETNVDVLETGAIHLVPGWHEAVAEATDNDGLQGFSVPVRFFVERGENAGLPTPDRVSATALTATEIQLIWPSLETNAPNQSIAIERWEPAGSLWIELGRVAASDTDYIDSGLNPETNYRYRIALLDPGGTRSAYSAEASATTRTVLSNYAIIDLSASLGSADLAVTNEPRLAARRKNEYSLLSTLSIRPPAANARSIIPQDLTPLPMNKLEPLWMAEDGSCLLKEETGKYVLWRPDRAPGLINNPDYNFLAHRLTREGIVVGAIAEPVTQDEAGNWVQHSWGAWWNTDLNTPVPLTKFEYRWPKNAAPLPSAGLTYSLVNTPSGAPEFLATVTSYPTLQDVWDLNSRGQAVGSVCVQETFMPDRVGFGPDGRMNWFNATERGLDATFGANSVTETHYQALLDTAAEFSSGGTDWRWLGPLAAGNSAAVAQLVNDAGTIAGYGGLFTGVPVLDALRPSHAFRAAASGDFDGSSLLLTDLGVLPGGAHSMPRAMNQAGQLVGFSDFDVVNTGGIFDSPINSHAVFWDPTNTLPEWLTNFPPGPGAPSGYGDAFAINDHGQIAGASMTADSRPVAVLWQRNHNTNGTPFWEITDLNEHLTGSGWQLFRAVGINNAGWMLAHAFDATGEKHSVLLVPSGLGVDANRDGQITFDQNDQTSSERPYRFWLNDDMDVTTSSFAWSETDPEVYPPTRPDSADRIINSPRDCEDLTRLWLDLRGVLKMLQNPGTSFYVGLKWKNFDNARPSIRLFRSADSGGGLGHIKDARIAALQAQGNSASEVDGMNFCLLDISAGESSQAPIDAIDRVQPSDRPADFIFKKSAFAGLSEAQSKLFLLFEGVSEGKGELELVFLQRHSDGSWKQIGAGPSVWLDLKNIRRMYVRAYSTPVPEDFPLPWQSKATKSPPGFPYVEEDIPFGGFGALTIPDTNLGFAAGDSLESPSDYPFDPPPDEQKKCVVFVHGIALTVAEQQGYAQSFFKRLWWEGYRGRLVAFRWSTTLTELDAWLNDGENFSIFNSGEYRSWKQGTSLRKYVNNLQSELGPETTISLVGHSLGNACVGEALREGLKVSRYVGMETAVPLSCYYAQTEDPDHPMPVDPDLVAADQAVPTPQFANELGYQGYLAGIGNSLAAEPISYYNADDFWLATGTTSLRVGGLDMHWLMNERKYKPDNRVGFGKYDYESQFGQPRRPGFRSGLFYQRWVQDPHESMSFVSRPRTRPLGAGEPPYNFAGVNLKSDYAFDLQRSCHSGQFQRNIQLMYGNREGIQWSDERGRPRPLFLRLMRDLNIAP